MAKTMKAAVVHEFGKPLRIEEVPIPTLAEGEVLIKMMANGGMPQPYGTNTRLGHVIACGTGRADRSQDGEPRSVSTHISPQRKGSIAMSQAIEFTPAELNDFILRCQYNDLTRRRTRSLDGEYRLLWAVLEDAIRTYLANSTHSNPTQSRIFEEVRSWFESARNQEGLFGFESICGLLEIDPGRLLKGLKSVDARAYAAKRRRLVRNGGVRSLAA